MPARARGPSGSRRYGARSLDLVGVAEGRHDEPKMASRNLGSKRLVPCGLVGPGWNDGLVPRGQLVQGPLP
jgi:hypothetical protein